MKWCKVFKEIRCLVWKLQCLVPFSFSPSTESEVKLCHKCKVCVTYASYCFLRMKMFPFVQPRVSHRWKQSTLFPLVPLPSSIKIQLSNFFQCVWPVPALWDHAGFGVVRWSHSCTEYTRDCIKRWCVRLSSAASSGAVHVCFAQLSANPCWNDRYFYKLSFRNVGYVCMAL